MELDSMAVMAIYIQLFRERFSEKKRKSERDYSERYFE